MHDLPALGDLRLFCVVLQRGSLAAAAAEIGASPSFVSKRLRLLEVALGTKLLHRTTRRLAATDDGLTVLRSLWDVAESLAAGRLEQVLPGYGQAADIWAVYPTRLSRSPKVQLFLDMLARRLRGGAGPLA